MKKYIYLLAIVLFGSLAFAAPEQTPPPVTDSTVIEPETTDVTNVTEEVVEEIKPEQEEKTPEKEAEYTTVEKGDKIFYYDKYGKLIAHDKKVKNQTFFYDKTGQLVGRSLERDEKTYYYNSFGKFLGVCDENGCVDKDFTSTGKIPPLPAIKHFVPVYDNNIMNPPPKIKSEDEEE